MDFYKKEKKRRKKIIITVLIILVIFFVVLHIGIRLNFLIKDEMYIEIEPIQNVVYTDYNKPVVLDFKVKNENFWFCKSFCSFGLYDTYSEKKIFLENGTYKTHSNIEKSYIIGLDVRGKGQRIYYFEVECNNVRSLLCQTDEEKIYRSSIVTINYDLPEDEFLLKEELKKHLNEYTKKLTIAMNKIEYNNFIIDNASLNITSSILDFERLDNAKNDLNKIQELWKKDKYNEIKEKFDLSYVDRLLYEVDLKLNNTLYLISAYNNNILDLNNIISKMSMLNEAYKFYQMTNNKKASKIVNMTIILQKNYLLFKELTKRDLEQAKALIQNLNLSVENILSEYNNDVKEYNNEIDMLLRYNKRLQDELIDVIGGQKASLKNNTCESLGKLIENYVVINTNAQNLKINNYSSYINDTNFIESINQCKNNLINKTELNYTFNLTKKQCYSLIEFNESLELSKLRNKLCYTNYDNLSYNLIPLEEIKIPPFIEKDTSFIEFKDNPTRCCIFHNCSECKISEKPYPTVLIHGHLSYKRNPVTKSLSTFTKIQRKMSYENHFINAGDIDVKNTNESWSLMSYPIAVRASYYYITYYDINFLTTSVKKSESIENYAIRLKEIIETVKKKTGAKKVNLVAHSMGGLVVRDYIALFGENNVNKVVLIATPNHGIIGDVKLLCSKFGEKKECEDMYENSIFLKRLNKEKPNVPFYVIYGTGCKTSGHDGDGIVTAESAKLDYAENIEIKGKCSDLLNTDMHSDLLDPEKYPEVYEKLISILG